jgi:hypothetical protein
LQHLKDALKFCSGEYANYRFALDLTDFLNQRDRDYCIGMISSRW